MSIPYNSHALKITGKINGSLIPGGLKTLDPMNRISILSGVYGVDENVARAIIMCESQFDPRINTTLNKDKTWDYGFWQLNSIHIKEYAEIGFRIYDTDENLEAGFYMLSKDGTGPWYSSKSCWGPLLRKTILARSGSS